MKPGQSEAPRSRMEIMESIQDSLKLSLIRFQKFTFLPLSHIVLFYHLNIPSNLIFALVATDPKELMLVGQGGDVWMRYMHIADG